MAMALLFGSCSLPQVTPEARIFLNLSLEFLGEYQLPQTEFEGTTVGGLSALSYDRRHNRIYALCDDHIQPRFYTLNVTLSQPETAPPALEQITIEAVTFLQGPEGEPYPDNELDPEGLAVIKNRLFISSEGVADQESPPLIAAFNAATGNIQGRLRLPNHFLAAPEPDPTSTDPTSTDPTSTVADSTVAEPAATVTAAASEETAPQGVADNLGLESLTLSPEGDRLFTATEFPLLQDYDPEASEPERYNRLLHYWIGEPDPLLLAEHLYPLDPPPAGVLFNGLTELATLDGGGHFLSLERSYSPFTGYGAQLFQMAMAGANDTVKVDRLPHPLTNIRPVPKQPLFNLAQLDLPLGNLEGMMVGPTLKDGSRTVLLVSDNGLEPDQNNQFLWFRLTQNPQMRSHT